MNELPNGWITTSLGDVADYIQRGKSPKYTEHSELPVINQKCIRWHGLEIQHLKFIHPDQFSSWDKARYVVPGDILWNSTGTGTVGRAYLVQEADCTLPKVVDSHVTIVRANSLVDARYVFNLIKGPAVQNKIEEMCDGTTNQIELSRAAISATEIPLAPLPEQKRIADKLDAVLARVDACLDRLDRIPAILKRFRQSILAAATSGKLTEDWRADMSISMEETWSTKKLKDISTDVSYGYTASSVDVPKGPKMLRITDIQSNQVDWGAVPYCEIENSKKKQYILKHGDLVFARMGATVGKSFLIWGDIPEAVFASYLIRVRCNDSNSIEYLALFFQSNAYWSQIMEFSAGVAQPSVNGTKLKELIIPLPGVQEQHEIVRCVEALFAYADRLEALFAYADRLEARYAAARAQVEKLTPATLAKAFRGELVPQDPNDEPASALLERIRAQRSDQSANKLKRGCKIATKIEN